MGCFLKGHTLQKQNSLTHPFWHIWFWTVARSENRVKLLYMRFFVAVKKARRWSWRLLRLFSNWGRWGWKLVRDITPRMILTWWRHQMEIFSALLAFCVGNSPVTGEFPAQSPVTRSFDVFFDLRLNQQLSKQWRRWWFETPSRSLWRLCNECGDILKDLVSRFEWCQPGVIKITDGQINFAKNVCAFAVSTVPADGLAPSGAGTSAGALMTK